MFERWRRRRRRSQVGSLSLLGPRSKVLRNTERELFFFRSRVLVAGLVALGCFALLLTRFVWLQVFKHDDLHARAEQNRTLIDELAQVVEVQPRDRRRFAKLREELKGADSIPIRTRLSDEEVARFAAHRWRFPQVQLRARLLATSAA